jgi:hypothetical protein
MNEAVGATGVVIANIISGEGSNGVEEHPEANPMQAHVPPTDIAAVSLTNEEANMEDDLPDLIPQGDEDKSNDDAEDEDDDMPSLNGEDRYDSDNEVAEEVVAEVENEADKGKGLRDLQLRKEFERGIHLDILNYSMTN